MIGDSDLAVPGKLLDFYALQHKLIAHNLANSGVKDFKSVHADFKGDIAQAIAEGDAEKALATKLVIKQDPGVGVNPETEVSAMTKNQLMYDTVTQIAAHKMRMLRLAISSK